MENFKVSKIILLLIFSIVFVACQDSGLFESSSVAGNDISLVENEAISMDHKDVVNYPLSGSVDILWNSDSCYYEGGNIHFEDGTKFHVKSDAFIPPKHLLKYYFEENGTYDYQDIAEIRKISKKRKPVTITMRIDLDKEKNELIYTFGPHGSRFSKPARIVFDYSSLGTNTANLFYIENDGSYVEQPFDHIDIKAKKIYLYIDHFSRYAMSYGG